MKTMIICMALLLALVTQGTAFVSVAQPSSVAAKQTRVCLSLDAKKGGWSNMNPLKELSDMVSSLDDVVDDFMGKRMGNGEVFYGQRKYKPSGRENTNGSYNGMGLTDKTRIEIARERKEAYLAMKKARELRP